MRNRHIARVKALRVLKAQCLSWERNIAYYHRLLTTRKPCSCPMCGNPRRHFGEKTRQEKRADEDMADQIKNVVGRPTSRVEALRVSKETIASAEQERNQQFNEAATKILRDRADSWRSLSKGE